MRRTRRWRLTRRRGISNIIATILLLGTTVAAGAILWTFSLHLSPTAPTLGVTVRAGTSNPVWGDPTDCLPWFPAWLGYNTQVSPPASATTADYLLTGTDTYTINGATTWGHWWNDGLSNISSGVSGHDLYTDECSDLTPPGDFSVMNSTQFIIASSSASDISLADIELTFVCNGTVFVQGTLASMTWFPGSSSSPAPDAPHLETCGTFVPSGSFSTLYNRFGLFVPLTNTSSTVQNGDTFIMYVHTSSPFDPDVEGENDLPGTGHDCGPGPDCDDYHGAPPWCFTQPVTVDTGCTLDLSYLGNPNTLFFSLPLYNLIRG